jgi:glycosyltransferase involved in cell wall biosynthesis
LLRPTILTVLEEWKPVWVVLDGSTDSSVAEAHDLQRDHSELRLFSLSQNHGKGGAALVAMKAPWMQDSHMRFSWMRTDSIPPIMSSAS